MPGKPDKEARRDCSQLLISLPIHHGNELGSETETGDDSEPKNENANAIVNESGSVRENVLENMNANKSTGASGNGLKSLSMSVTATVNGSENEAETETEGDCVDTIL